MAQFPPTVYPAAFGRFSVNTRPMIDTKLGERTYNDIIMDLTKYGSRRVFIRYEYIAERY